MAAIDFTMHPQLLRDVIQRQAGSLWKATLEGVMNSIEAGATRVDITVGPRRLQICDDGRGFTSAEQIQHCFRVFGQPHDAAEGKVWAEFRMGRGQLFAHGVNTWRTGSFRMTVNIAARLGFDLDEGLPEQPGCTIDVVLTSGLSDSDIFAFGRELERAVRYVAVPVSLNGAVISQPPAGLAWDAISTPDAYFRVKPGSSGIDVYNAGVYLQTIHGSTYGLSGTVVSLSKLQVNFARNDVMSTCPVWKRIRMVLEANARVRRAPTPTVEVRLTGAGRVAAITRLRAGDLTRDEFRRQRFLWDVSGAGLSVEQIRRGRKHVAWTCGDAADPRVQQLRTEGRILVLDRACIAALGVAEADVMGRLWRVREGYDLCIHPGCQYVPLAVATAHHDGAGRILSESEWTPNERRWVAVLTWAMYQGHGAAQRAGVVHPQRRVLIGSSTTCDSWTDGQTYIALNRGTVALDQPLVQRGRLAMDRLWPMLACLAHELSHDAPSFGAAHDQVFLQRHHDLERQGFLGRPLAQVPAYWTPRRLDALTARIARGRADVLAALAAGEAETGDVATVAA